MHTGDHRLARQSGGIGLYATVTVGIEFTTGDTAVEFSGTEFAWLKESYGPDAVEGPGFSDYRRGAVRGVQYALHHLEGSPQLQVRIMVSILHVNTADSTEDTVAYAACFATWKALGKQGTAEPIVADGKVFFPS